MKIQIILLILLSSLTISIFSKNHRSRSRIRNIRSPVDVSECEKQDNEGLCMAIKITKKIDCKWSKGKCYDNKGANQKVIIKPPFSQYGVAKKWTEEDYCNSSDGVLYDKFKKMSLLNTQKAPTGWRIKSLQNDLKFDEENWTKRANPHHPNCSACPAIYAYSTDSYKAIKCYMKTDLYKELRDGSYPPMVAFKTKLEEELNTPGICGFPQEIPKSVYSGLQFGDVPLAMKVGETFSNLTPFSTTSNIKVTINWSAANMYNFKSGEVPIRGQSIKSCSHHPEEDEFLLNMNQCWRLAKITNTNEINQRRYVRPIWKEGTWQKVQRVYVFKSIPCDSSIGKTIR